jgi:hypothetical protein
MTLTAVILSARKRRRSLLGSNTLSWVRITVQDAADSSEGPLDVWFRGHVLVI